MISEVEAKLRERLRYLRMDEMIFDSANPNITIVHIVHTS